MTSEPEHSRTAVDRKRIIAQVKNCCCDWVGSKTRPYYIHITQQLMMFEYDVADTVRFLEHLLF